MADRMKRLVMALPLVLLGGVALAQSAGISDPTRPPASMGSLPADGVVQDGAPVGLQTIIRRKGAKPQAVINGETVSLGGKVGEQRVVKINETEVILEGPAGREVLTMTPGVEKKPVAVKKVSRPKSQAPATATKPNK